MGPENRPLFCLPFFLGFMFQGISASDDFTTSQHKVLLASGFGNQVLKDEDLLNLRELSAKDHKYLASAQNPCTYFHGFRYPEPQSNLENCTWYSSNSCCRRTEVTAVFKSMYKIDRASKDCKNALNYLMCFWCSPDQHLWFVDNQAIVCKDFCDMVYQNCSTAHYKGRKIGDHYTSGEEFCKAQNFRTETGKKELCFGFDKSVFSAATLVRHNSLLEVLTQALIIFRYLFLLEWIVYDTFIVYFIPDRLYIRLDRL